MSPRYLSPRSPTTVIRTPQSTQSNPSTLKRATVEHQQGPGTGSQQLVTPRAVDSARRRQAASFENHVLRRRAVATGATPGAAVSSVLNSPNSTLGSAPPAARTSSSRRPNPLIRANSPSANSPARNSTAGARSPTSFSTGLHDRPSQASRPGADDDGDGVDMSPGCPPQQQGPMVDVGHEPARGSVGMLISPDTLAESQSVTSDGKERNGVDVRILSPTRSRGPKSPLPRSPYDAESDGSPAARRAVEYNRHARTPSFRYTDNGALASARTVGSSVVEEHVGVRSTDMAGVRDGDDESVAGSTSGQMSMLVERAQSLVREMSAIMTPPVPSPGFGGRGNGGRPPRPPTPLIDTPSRDATASMDSDVLLRMSRLEQSLQQLVTQDDVNSISRMLDDVQVKMKEICDELKDMKTQMRTVAGIQMRRFSSNDCADVGHGSIGSVHVQSVQIPAMAAACPAGCAPGPGAGHPNQGVSTASPLPTARYVTASPQRITSPGRMASGVLTTPCSSGAATPQPPSGGRLHQEVHRFSPHKAAAIVVSSSPSAPALTGTPARPAQVGLSPREELMTGALSWVASSPPLPTARGLPTARPGWHRPPHVPPRAAG